jgi:hypothetical protein
MAAGAYLTKDNLAPVLGQIGRQQLTLSQKEHLSPRIVPLIDLLSRRKTPGRAVGKQVRFDPKE